MRHLARRKNRQTSTVSDPLLGATDRTRISTGGIATAERIDRKDSVADRGDRGENRVGNESNIRADLRDQVVEDHGIKAAESVIRHHHQRALLRNLGQFLVAGEIARVEPTEKTLTDRQ